MDLSGEKKKERLREIQDKFDKMKEYSEDKVQLTVQMYEMVSVQYSMVNKQAEGRESYMHATAK